MIKLTSRERIVWRELRRLAQAGVVDDPFKSCLHYGELGLLVDPTGQWRYPMTRPPFRGLNEALGHVSMYEVEHGRPLLSALVTAAKNDQPGAGFAKLARYLGFTVDNPVEFWRDEVERTVVFWSASDPVLLLDAAMDRVLSELAAIKRLVR